MVHLHVSYKLKRLQRLLNTNGSLHCDYSHSPLPPTCTSINFTILEVLELNSESDLTLVYKIAVKSMKIEQLV